MSTLLIFLLIVAVIGAFYFFRKMKQPKDVDLSALQTDVENMLEPIISYSIYTVDVALNHRYLNYTHKDFPNHIGILKNQYIEIDWNIINADLITISGVGLVKAIGRKAFYPIGNTSYIITAKNKEYEITQTIFVRVFPQNVIDKLFAKQPNIRIHTQQITKTLAITVLPNIAIKKPKIETQKIQLISLNKILEEKINIKTFTQKVKEYISTNQTTKKNQDGRF